MEKISKYIVNIIGCHRPEAQIGKGVPDAVGATTSPPPPTLQLAYFLILELSTYHSSLVTHYT